MTMEWTLTTSHYLVTADIPSLPEVLGVSHISIAAPGRPQMLYNLPEFGNLGFRVSARLCNGHLG